MVADFLELGLSNELLNAVAELGFEKPTPVQGTVIPKLLMEEGDIVCLAQTGTGKTAAFGLPALEYLDLKNPKTQILVLCPTRELCRQISQDLTNYSKYLEGIRIVSVYGGANITGQIKDLGRGAHIIVATPGRLLDLLKREFHMTSVVVTHDLVSALNIGDTVAMLYEGRVIECAPPKTFMKSENPLVREFITAQFHTRKAGDL